MCLREVEKQVISPMHLGPPAKSQLTGAFNTTYDGTSSDAFVTKLLTG